MIGTKVGAYDIREKIGTGGMATVYRAYQPSMERFVAVKVIRSAILSEPTLRERFTREARLIARLEHPHLLPIYEFDGDHDPPFIVMRFLEGGTLKQVMSSGRIPHGEVVYMLRQVASALDYAHRQGIVHRDLKPSNVMIDREGNAFIADFGIARITDSQEDLTGTGMLIGTPGYMAPEQARGESKVDHRADLYSLGAIVFEMLTGRPPFVADSNLAVVMAHINEPVPNAREVNKELPKGVDAVLRRALAKGRDERFETASALVDAVAKALAVKGNAAPTQLQSMTEFISREQLAAFAASQDGPNGPDTPTDQQRQMTAVYFDVAELSEAYYAQGRETESVRAEMDALWTRFGEIVAGFGGAVQSRTDEVGVALWGLERSREDDAEQCIRATLKMRDTTEEKTRGLYGAEWKPDEEQPIPFLAGITSGPVLLERSGETSSYTATGATITLAGRLKEAAPPGGILVDHDTFTQVRGVFSFYEHDPVRVRGRKDPVEVYLAVQARPRAFRLQARGIEGVETKMIGREIELRLLQEAMSLTVEDGETQVVTVVGDAGVGKSRLLHEFTQWIDLIEQTLWFFEARATQPSMLQPYSMTRDLFSFRFQILDSDSLETVHEKFVKGIAQFMGEGSADKARLIGHLVGFDFSSHAVVNAALQDPDAFQKRALGHLGEFFVAATQKNPIFIQIEDIHWADDRSLDLINNLVRENTRLPLFVICMARPSLYERRPQWGEGQRFHARIALEPLSQLSSRRLVKEILKRVEHVPTELRDLIIDRAEGNPFYIEELIKALIDDRVIVKGEEHWTVDETRLSAVRIPPTLTGVLQSRLDTLPSAHQQLLQRASVVGRVFWDSAVTHLSQADGVTEGTVNAILNELRQREMIFRREESGFGGTGEYVFRHAILRDVTYQTVVPRLRRLYHKRVGDWLLGIGGERANELTLLVARHYEQAGEPALAAEQLQKAGVTAMLHGSYRESIQSLEMGRALIASGDEHRALRLEIDVRLGETYTQKGEYDKAREYLEPALAEARATGEKPAQAKAAAHLGRIASIWQLDPDAAVAYLEEALPLARELDDTQTLLFVLRSKGNLLFITGAEDPGPYLTESLELARQIGDRGAMAAAINSLGNLKGEREQYDEAIAAYEESLRLFRELGNTYGVIMVGGNLAEIALQLRKLEEAERWIAELRPLVQELGNQGFIANTHASEGLLYALQGKLDPARKHVAESLRIGLTTQDVYSKLVGLRSAAAVRHRQGDPRTALEWLGTVLASEVTDASVRNDAQILISEIRPGLADTEVEEALARGSKLDLEATAQTALEAMS